MSLRAQLLSFIFVLCIPACFVRPFFGIVMWMVVAFANPQAYTWGAWAFPWAVATGVPTLLGMLCFSRGYRRLLGLESLLLMAFWVWIGITSYVSTSDPIFEHHSKETWYRLTFVSKILLMTFATMVIVKDRRQLHIYLRSIACCFGVFVARMFPAVIASGGGVKIFGPQGSMIADNNDVGLALNMTLPLFFFLAQMEEQLWLRRMFAALFVMAMPVILCTYSRGALVGLIVVVGMMILQLRQRWMLIPVAILLVAGVLAFAPKAWLDRMNPSKERVIDKSAESRLVMWTFAWRLVSDHPVTGGGFATFTPQLFHRYAPEQGDIFQAHSIYFQVLAEHGFTGLAIYLTIVASSLVSILRLTRRARREDDPDVIHWALMIRFAMTGFLVSGAFLGLAYFDYYFALLAALVVLKDIAYHDWNTPREWDDDEMLDHPSTTGELARSV